MMSSIQKIFSHKDEQAIVVKLGCLNNMLQCGHNCADMKLIIRSNTLRLYCDKCKESRQIWRDSTGSLQNKIDIEW